MSDYVDSALFVFTEESASFRELLQQNPQGVEVTPVAFASLKENPAEYLRDAAHVVISGSMGFLKEMVGFAVEYDFSIGLILLPEQKSLARASDLPEDIDGQIELAFRKDAKAIDVIQCNEKILFFKATIGRIPMIDNPIQTSRLRILLEGLKKLWTLRLLSFSISALGEQKTDIQTAACGCMIAHKRSLASKLIAHDSSGVDGMISLVIVAPFP
ncbi:MAG: hypothetical protein ACWGN1_06360 [Desulfobulbales bacterium]